MIHFCMRNVEKQSIRHIIMINGTNEHAGHSRVKWPMSYITPTRDKYDTGFDRTR